MNTEPTLRPSFQELSSRERLSAILDDGIFLELAGPFDRLRSPWLPLHGLVSQSDDGIVVVRGKVSGCEVVAIAIVPAFEGGGIGEVGGAKIAIALELAVDSCRKGRTISALLLLETGGVRLQEATLGLAAIARIQTAILALRELAPVVTVIAGPTGCFGGMSLAAALCTHIIGTPAGRLGMNGPEVIEQEAGSEEINATDREAIWQLIGCEARVRDGWMDVVVPDEAEAIAAAVREGFAIGVRQRPRLANAKTRVVDLRRNVAQSRAQQTSSAVVGGSR